MTRSGSSSKIELVTDAIARGAIHQNGDGRLQDEVTKQWKLDLFVLDSARGSRLLKSWPGCRQHVDQLRDELDVQHRVLLLEYDVSTTEPNARLVLKE